MITIAVEDEFKIKLMYIPTKMPFESGDFPLVYKRGVRVL